MTFEFLGTGSSFGVPQIGCDCEVCTSSDPRDRRLRTGAYIRGETVALNVDASADFRHQLLRRGITTLDAVFITHFHADHIFGVDDLRIFNKLNECNMPLYIPSEYLAEFEQTFHYTQQESRDGIMRPRFDFHEITESEYDFGDFSVIPVDVHHGKNLIKGYVFRKGDRQIAFLTDCKELPEKSRAIVRGSDYIILGALWDKDWRHPNHLNLNEALEFAEGLEGKMSYLTHFTHYIGRHDVLEKMLPANVRAAYDGLVLEI